jgi:hypothetical protein
MYKPLKKRKMSSHSGPLRKMINDEVEKRMSALKATDGEEKVVATRQGTNVDKGDGSGNFTRTTETDYQTKTRKNLPTYKEAWEQMTPQEKERFGSFEGFVKEAGEKPATEDQTTEISNRTESETREFAPTPDPGVAIYSDRNQMRIVVDAEGNTTVVDKNTSGDLEKLQSKISSLQEQNKPIPDHLMKKADKLGGVELVMGSEIHTPTKENAELYGVDYKQIGNQFEKDGVVTSAHNYIQNNPDLELDEFNRVPVGNNNDGPDYVEVPYVESDDKRNPENTVGQFKMNRNTSSKGQSKMIKAFGKPMSFRNNKH